MLLKVCYSVDNYLIIYWQMWHFDLHLIMSDNSYVHAIFGYSMKYAYHEFFV